MKASELGKWLADTVPDDADILLAPAGLDYIPLEMDLIDFDPELPAPAVIISFDVGLVE